MKFKSIPSQSYQKTPSTHLPKTPLAKPPKYPSFISNLIIIKIFYFLVISHISTDPSLISEEMSGGFSLAIKRSFINIILIW